MGPGCAYNSYPVVNVYTQRVSPITIPPEKKPSRQSVKKKEIRKTTKCRNKGGPSKTRPNKETAELGAEKKIMIIKNEKWEENNN